MSVPLRESLLVITKGKKHTDVKNDYLFGKTIHKNNAFV